MRYARGLSVGLALLLVTAGVAQKKDEKEKEEDKDVVAARESVLDVAKLIEGDKNGKAAAKIAARVKEIKTKHDDLGHLMKVFAPRDRGGLGIGQKPEPKSGLEAKIREVGRGRGFTAAKMKAEQAELLKVAHVSAAMADIVKPYFVKEKGGSGKKDWEKFADEQKAAAAALLRAVKANDGAAAAKAARDLEASCVACHKAFRAGH